MFSCLLHCCDWICHSTGLCLHTWFTQRSGSVVFDGCYCRILTSFWFLRSRLKCLSPVFASSREEYNLMGLASVMEEQKHENQESFPSGHLCGADVYSLYWTERHGGFSRVISSFWVSTSLILQTPPRVETRSASRDRIFSEQSSIWQIPSWWRHPSKERRGS